MGFRLFYEFWVASNIQILDLFSESNYFWCTKLDIRKIHTERNTVKAYILLSLTTTGRLSAQKGISYPVSNRWAYLFNEAHQSMAYACLISNCGLQNSLRVKIVWVCYWQKISILIEKSRTLTLLSRPSKVSSRTQSIILTDWNLISLYRKKCWNWIYWDRMFVDPEYLLEKNRTLVQ